MKSPLPYWSYALALLAFAVLGRLAPMPENFTPVAAVALFGGFLLPRGWQAVAVVWSTLLITDLFLGLYSPALMAAVYIAACAPMRPRRIGPVLRLDQHRRLAAGHGLQPGRQWLAGVPKRWRAFLAKCHCRRLSLFWRAIFRLGRCRTHHEFTPFFDPTQTHPSGRSSCLNW